MNTLAWILVVLLLVALVGISWFALKLRQRLDQANAELTELREALVVEEPDIKVPSALVAAGRVVGAVMGTAQHTAQRLRDEGMGGMLLGSLEELSRWALDQRSEIVRIADEDGTVTVFFSDIEGSTRLNSTLGDERWVKVLAAHDELVETYVEKYRGLIVKTQGDGHMVVFSTPQLAVAAALDINRALSANWNRSRHLRRTPIRVRIGLHKGTAIERDGDYFGQNVALAARIAARAQGGEILVSEEVAQVLDAEYDLLPAESVELKGFDGKHTLWQVEGPTG